MSPDRKPSLEPQEQAEFDQILNAVQQRHMSTESFFYESVQYPYGLGEASADAVDTIITQQGVTPIELLRRLSRATSLTPQQASDSFDLGNVMSTDSWEEAFNTVSTAILVAECQSRYPEMKKEDLRRLDKFDA